MLAVVWRTFDLVLRFIYVLATPILVVPVAAVVPMGGILAGVGIATVIALFGSERWRAKTERVPLVGRGLANMANLGDYYREHPPRPLVYYVLYPLLFPYWLFVRSARREFLLYRKVGGLAVVIIVASSAYEYLTKWRPEIPFVVYVFSSIGFFLVQLAATFSLIMPIVTTIVAFHQRHLHKTLGVLLALTVAFAAFATVIVMRQRHTSPTTLIRLHHRGTAEPQRAAQAMGHALDAAIPKLDGTPAGLDAAYDAARPELEALFRRDEADAFRLYRAMDGTTMLYINFDNHPAIFVARDAKGVIIGRRAGLPTDARLQLRGPE